MKTIEGGFSRAPRRRTLLRLGAAVAVGAALTREAARAQSAGAPRLALLIGNRDYPDGDDLPPIHKNVRDLHAALMQRGFDVTDGLDTDVPSARSLVHAFAARVRAAPPETIALFYFSGHGAQLDAENLLVGARTSPKAGASSLAKGSLTLAGDILAVLPSRPQALTIAILDACRTSITSLLEGSDGLNQVEAPPGCLIAFATGAGKPAIAPADESRNTFYTASLVKLLASASDEITFSDLFRLVKYDVQETMLNYPVPLLRQFAQYPFIAENLRVQLRLAVEAAQATAAPAAPRFGDADEAGDFARLAAALWPAEIERIAAEFLARHPTSKLAGSAQVAHEGAAEAARILRRNDVRLFRGAFDPAPGADEGQIAELAKAARGDKDAAARIGRTLRERDPSRYEGWLQYAAALGNGIASYELALHYRSHGQPLQAAQFEARARALGYTPPPSLDNRRK